MSSLNDTLTLGLILILLFGAVSLYLYTRIQQCEQKLNLVESILLDIKMSAELREYPSMKEHVKEAPLYSSDASSVKESETFTEMHEDALYQSALEEAALEVQDVSGIDVSELLDSKPTEELRAIEVTKAAPKASKASPIVTKLSANYESMTLAELKALAKQRQITGSSSMKRSQILDALRNNEKSVADGGVLSALSEQAEPIEEEGEIAA